jgi:hypothetical protein
MNWSRCWNLLAGDAGPARSPGVSDRLPAGSYKEEKKP